MNQQNPTAQNTFFRLSTGFGRRKIFFALSGDVPGNSRYDSSNRSSAPTNIKFKQKQKYEGHLLI